MVPRARGYGGFVPPHPHATVRIPSDDSFPGRGERRYPRAPGSGVPPERFPFRANPVGGVDPTPREHLAVPPAADEHTTEGGHVDEFQTLHRPRVRVRVHAGVSPLRPPPLRRRRRRENALRRRSAIRARTRRPVVVQPTRRRAVGGVTRLASRSGRRRFEPRRRRKRRAPRGEMSIPEVLGVGGGAPRATRGGRRREAPRRKRAKHQVQHVARKVERRGRAGIRTSLVRIPRQRRRFFSGRGEGRPGTRGRGRRGTRGRGRRGTPRTRRRRRARPITLGRDGDEDGRASRRGTIRTRRRRRRK